MKKTCSFEGCLRPFCAKGLCKVHYYQMRNTGRTFSIGPAKGVPLKFLKDLVGHRGKKCILWPYAQDGAGYGNASMGSLRTTAHRIMCILAHGEPSFDDAEAAHSCGNRLCVNPNHLRWATPLENNLDRYRHDTMPIGERNWASKFTRETVLHVISDPRSNAEIARQYGCSTASVWAIKTGKSWSHVTGIKPKAA